MGSLVGQRPSVTLEGCVVDVLGEPLPSASVTAQAGLETVGVTKCDGLGCFKLSMLPLETLAVVARAPGHHAAREFVELDEHQPEARIRMRLRDAVPVTGRVRGADGNGLAGALVVLVWVPRSESVDEDHVWTDAAGCYRLPAVPVGRTGIAVLATGYDAQHEVLLVADATTHDVQLWEGPTAGYRLTIHGASAEQWKQLYCRFTSHGPFSDVLDDLGSLWPHRREGDAWVYEGLPANLEIQQIHVSAGLAVPIDWPVDLVAGEQNRTGELHPYPQLVMVTDVVRGTVRDPSGKPLAGRRVARLDHRGMHESTLTDDAGHFEIKAQISAAGSFALALDEDEFVVHRDGARPDGTTTYVGEAGGGAMQAVVADRAASVSGRLLDNDGRPVFGAELQVLADDYENNPQIAGGWPDRHVAGCRSGRDGTFHFRRLDGHLGFSLWLRAAAPEGLHAEGPLRLTPGRDLDLGTIRLSKPAVIEGRMVGAVGYTIWLVRDRTLPNTEFFWTGCTDRFGRFRFGGLPAGSYAVKATPPVMRMEWPDYAKATVQAGERAVVGR
jgi:hypothetical protein